MRAAVTGAWSTMAAKRSDARGFLQELYRSDLRGRIPPIEQVNFSHTTHARTLHGMHGQLGLAKMVGCLRGRAYDVILDTRRDSITYGHYTEFWLDPGTFVYVPTDCTHGFQALTDDVSIIYLYSTCYDPKTEWGVRYDDPFFNVAWPFPVGSISERDLNFPPWGTL